MRRKALASVLIENGLASGQAEAVALIQDRRVLVDGAVALSANRQVAPAENVTLVRRDRYVSRGGEKLSFALEHFRIDTRDKIALDIGASTGGFTDCLLQRGCAHVVALDTGKNLLHERLQNDSRVVVMDNVNIRIQHDALQAESFDLVVVDVSFMSVRTIAVTLHNLLKQDGDLIVLVKPQFESKKSEADRAEGVIVDPRIHGRVIDEVREALKDAGLHTLGIVQSPITGHSGNIEFLVHCRVVGPVGSPDC